MRARWRDRSEDGLADECAAFLTGTLTDCQEADGLAIPTWAWTNLLAHGTSEMLADAVSRPGRRRLRTRCWWIARSELAEVILAVSDGVSLCDLQSSVLIPLELELASRTDVPFWTAREWMNAVTSELGRHNHVPNRLGQ